MNQILHTFYRQGVPIPGYTVPLLGAALLLILATFTMDKRRGKLK